MKNAEMATLVREQAETIRAMGMRIDDLSIERERLFKQQNTLGSELQHLEIRFHKAQRVYAVLMTRIITKEGKAAYKELVAQFKKDSF